MFKIEWLRTVIALVSTAAIAGPVCAATLALENTYALDPVLAQIPFNFHPQGLGYDTGSNELLFMQQNSNTIYRTDLTGSLIGSRPIGEITIRPDGFSTPTAQYTTSVAGDGTNYYFSDYTNNSFGYDLYTIGKTTGTAVNLSSEVSAYGGVPIDVRDGLLFRTEASTTYSYSNLDQLLISSISDVDTITSVINLDTTAGIGDIAVDTNTGSLFVLDYSSNASIRRLDLSTGALLDTYALGIDGLTAGITYADGKVYYYDWNSGGGALSVYNVLGSGFQPVPEVSATGALAAFGSLLAMMAFLWERRRVTV